MMKLPRIDEAPRVKLPYKQGQRIRFYNDFVYHTLQGKITIGKGTIAHITRIWDRAGSGWALEFEIDSVKGGEAQVGQTFATSMNNSVFAAAVAHGKTVNKREMALNTVIRALEQFSLPTPPSRRSNSSGYATGRNDMYGPRISRDTNQQVTWEVRDWGDWVTPTHSPFDDDEDGWDQDFDWNNLDKKDLKFAFDTFKRWVKAQPWSNLVRKVDYEVGEKNWLSLTIVVK